MTCVLFAIFDLNSLYRCNQCSQLPQEPIGLLHETLRIIVCQEIEFSCNNDLRLEFCQ